MFAANTKLDVGPGLATLGRGDFDELADAFYIKANERVGRIDALVDIVDQEAGGVVAADAKSSLGQVIGSE
jgi:hypothetical protein